MTGSPPDRVRALLQDALRRPPSARLDFVRSACGDEANLLAQVIALLESDDGSTVAAVGADPDAAPPVPPSEFRGTHRFVLRRRLGSGSFGVVYEALDLLKEQTVALKTLQHLTPQSLYSFKHEFRSLAHISHRNLVQLLELASHDEHWFFTMELVRGRHFLEHVWEGPDPGTVGPGNTLVPALRQLVHGLDALHRSGHLHRDVKPANVLVTPDERVVLLDFGLVLEVDVEATHQSLLIAGTPTYMSPEQAAGLPLTAASDWYSVGVMLYQALTGSTPFEGTYLHVLTEKQRTEPEPPASRVADVPPGLNALCQELLRRDPSGRPPVEAILEALEDAGGPQDKRPQQRRARETTQPFVGRRRQLATLMEAFQKVLAGTPVLAIVSGASGIGKSALVRAALDEIRAGHPSAVVLTGRCYERESVPYKALDSLVDSLARHLKQLPPHEADVLLPREIGSIAQVFPLLREFQQRLPPRGAPPREAQELRRRACAGLRELLGRLGDRRPLVLFVDDLQWGDIDSAGLLTEIIRRPDGPVLLFVAAYRDVELETSPFLRAFLTDEVRSDPGCVQVRVEPLDADESRELAAALLHSPVPAAREMASAIASESGGSPFFIDELVRFAEAGEADLVESRPSERPADTDAREATLAHMIEIRLSRLPRAAQQLLRTVAVNGRPIPEHVLVSAAGVPSSETALALLRSEHLLRARETEHGTELEPYHDRIRENVVRSLSAEELTAWHARLASALEEAGAADAELLAEHFSGAGDGARAAHYFILAGQHAERALAFDRAARLYRRTLELLPQGASERDPCMVSLGRALTNAGRCAEAAAVYLAVPAATTAEALELKQQAAQQLLFAGHIDEGLKVLREVLGSIGMTLPETRRQTVAALAAGRLRVRLRGLGFREREAGAVSPEELNRVDACWSVAAGLGVVDTMRGAVFQTRHLLLALRAGELARVHRALCMETVFIATGGPGAVPRAERVRRMARSLRPRVGTPYADAMQLLTDGASDYLVAKWRPAATAIGEAERIFTDHCTGVIWELDSARFFGIWALNELGEVRALGERFPVLLKDAQDRGDLYASTTISGLLAHVTYLANGDPDAASRHTSEAIQRWAQSGFHMPHLWELWSAADIAMYQGRGRDAYSKVESTWPVLERSLLLEVHFTRVSMLNLKGRAALSAAVSAVSTADRGRFCDAVLDCARALERCRGRWAEALALMLRAGTAKLQADDERALTLFNRAHDALVDLEMSLVAAVARRRCGELTGGDAGRTLVADSENWMRAQDIRDPAAFARMFSPAPP